MIRYGKKICLCFVLIVMSFSSVVHCFADHVDYTNDDIEKTMEEIIQWKKNEQGIKYKNLFSSDFAKLAGSTVSDWCAVAIGRMGYDDDYGSYLASLKINLQNTISEKGKDSIKATDWQRIALAVLSLGEDPVNFIEDVNLINEGVYQIDKLEKQGVNAYIWALITIDSLGYEADKIEPNIRQKLVDRILKSQCDNGGFTLDGKNPDIDITAMALQSLSPYYNQYKSAIDKALNWISKNQTKDGDFVAYGGSNLESTAQVIVALCSLGISPDSDSRFIKNGNTALDGLMKYKMKDNGFAHTLLGDEDKSNSIASTQALYSLCAVYRHRAGLKNFYDFTSEDNSKGDKGYVINIFSKKTFSAGFKFSDSDLDEMKSLPDKLTGEHYDIVARLFEKLKQSENKSEYNDAYLQLEQMYEQVKKIREEVESINNQIAENLYPFDNIESKDKDIINQLVKRTENLSEYDKSQVLGYEDLMVAKAKVDSNSKSIVIFISVGAVVVLLVLIILIKRNKKRKIRRAEEVENEDW